MALGPRARHVLHRLQAEVRTLSVDQRVALVESVPDADQAELVALYDAWNRRRIERSLARGTARLDAQSAALIAAVPVVLERDSAALAEAHAAAAATIVDARREGARLRERLEDAD